MATNLVVQEKGQLSTSFSLRIRRSKSSAAKPGVGNEHVVPRSPGFLSTSFTSSNINITMTNTPFPISNAASQENSTLSLQPVHTNLFPALDTVRPNAIDVDASKPLRSKSTRIIETPPIIASALSPTRITMSAFAKSARIPDDTSYYRQSSSGSGSIIAHSASKYHSVSQNSVSRRRWNSPSVSRSPSPSSKDERSSRDEDESTPASSISSTSPAKPYDDGGFDELSDVKNRKGSGKLQYSNTIKKTRRISKFIKTQSADIQSMKSISNERLHVNIKLANAKRVKDELWEAYKILENDYQKFHSKSGLQKTIVIRQGLLPFLRKYNGKSSRIIPPEELEKRTRTLHRWWTGLIAQLRNRNLPAMAGGDRPVYLEAISYIMSRPEWRTAPSTFAPLSERLSSSEKSDSSASLSSASSRFSLQKSVQHNIKVLFTRTLFDTLAYTIEKLGFRTAPPALVALGGKAIAFAFYFCQGVAEKLISIWGLQPANVRRVFSEFGIARGADLRDVSEPVVGDFPEPLHSIGITTYSALIKQMKQPKQPPVGVQINWDGPWTCRWCGRDSDLIFVFFKYYHILMCDYLSPDAMPAARLCAPGYVHVLSQLLSLVDQTIHRNIGAPDLVTSTTTFDDLLNATAAIPIPVRSLARSMAENKLIVLLRDVLFDGNYIPHCRSLYAHSFVTMLKTAVKKTHLYDADACFQLCDLVEELLPILTRAAKEGIGDFIDWRFWLDVAQTMLYSENNMTELRVITFVYTSWEILVEDERRKEIICLEWLLSTRVWNRFFCHWCPMVRAYYMRLLCWRLGRYDGEASTLDIEIYKTMLIRLRTGYAHHMQLKENFEITGQRPSSTAPCLPAPSRRLVILRNDTVVQPQAVLLSGLVPSSVPFDASPGSLLRSHSTTSLASLPESDIQYNAPLSSGYSDENPSSNGNRRWSQLRSVFGFKTTTAVGERSTPLESPPGTNRSSADSMIASDSPEPQTITSFKFSLEWIDRPMFGRERILEPSRLASSTQKYLKSFLDDDNYSIEVSSAALIAKHWTYIGRALSEWLLVIVEYENFFERRKAEGIETDKDVETPSLCAESMRKF